MHFSQRRRVLAQSTRGRAARSQTCAEFSVRSHGLDAPPPRPAPARLFESPNRHADDNQGVEIVERTGRNPQYEYIQLGCSKNAERRMLHYARTTCLGRPFSNVGMARSILWPRQTDNSSFFCAGMFRAALDSP